MKRTFKRPDGTEETLEGTAEELAEYERKLNESERKAPKPGVLKGKELEDLVAKLKESIGRLESHPLPHWPPRPIWIASCSICGRIGCNGYHGWGLGQPLYTGPIGGLTVTSNEIYLVDQPLIGLGQFTTCLESASS